MGKPLFNLVVSEKGDGAVELHWEECGEAFLFSASVMTNACMLCTCVVTFYCYTCPLHTSVSRFLCGYVRISIVIAAINIVRSIDMFRSVQFSYYINNRQPSGSLSNVLSRLAVGVRVDGDDETQRKEHEREGDQEEGTRHRVLSSRAGLRALARRQTRQIEIEENIDREEGLVAWRERGEHRRLDARPRNSRLVLCVSVTSV